MELLMSNVLEVAVLDRGAVMITIDGMTFAKRVKEAREAARLTQAQLAEGCGISDRTVSAWENGVAEGIRGDTLFCIADKMRVDPRWLVTGAGEAPGMTTALDEIVRGLEDLPVEQQEAVRALILSLKR
jgi:transcriptional regulator with XRE-family HTH domain